MTRAVLFDLGGTLAAYFGRHEFPGLLAQALTNVETVLRARSVVLPTPEAIAERVRAVNHEADDFCVRPLADRLATIYGLGPLHRKELLEPLCRRFMAPLFARGRLYPDTLPTLQRLRDAGLRTAIVSNTPWGSPGALWREELDRLDLANHVDLAVFCTDVGWRKPAKPIFEHALARLSCEARECFFVGDDPRWDTAGAQAMGMPAVLIDREGARQDAETPAIRSLDELWPLLRA